MKENSARYSVLAKLSPAASAVRVEYVWYWNSSVGSLYAFEWRSDLPPNAGGATLLRTTSWSYPYGSAGMSPGTALVQPSCPLTVPRLNDSKSVVTVSAAATPHASRAALTAVASTMKIPRIRSLSGSAELRDCLSE